jgi:hypothetical protein
MPVRTLNLVAPLAHKATVKHTTDTAATARAASGATRSMIGQGLRGVGVESVMVPPTPGTATSTTASSATTTAALSSAAWPCADSDLFSLLVRAYLDCRRTKRNSRSALAFEAHLERNLYALYRRLLDGTYRPGRSICFVVTEPRPREVWAAEFADRIVHWLLYNHIAPRFHAGFIADSCACIPGRGTLYAAQRLESHARSITRSWTRRAFYLKADLANFFVSIDKTQVLQMLLCRISEPWWRWLAETILMHDPRHDVEVRGDHRELKLVPPHKSLFNAPDGHGLPIGNLSSQFFANVLLDGLDQHAKHRVGARHYVRYVDDFVLLHESPQWLNHALGSIEEKLADLRLALNPRKTILQPVDRGIDFVGQIVLPHRRMTRRLTLRKALRRLKDTPVEDLYASGNSYLGLVRQTGSSHYEQALIARIMLKRGHVVDGQLNKAFRRCAP